MVTNEMCSCPFKFLLLFYKFIDMKNSFFSASFVRFVFRPMFYCVVCSVLRGRYLGHTVII